MATYYWVGGTGTWDNASTTNWAFSTGGAGGAGVPNNTDTAIFDSNSGTGDVSVDATAVSLNTTLNSSTINLTLIGSPTLGTSTGTFTLTLGTLTLNTFTLTCGRFSSSNSNTRTIAFGTGNITITGNAATVLTMTIATGFTYTGVPTVNATYAGSTGTRTLSFGSTGATEANALDYNISSGSDIVTIGNTTKNLNFTGFSGTLTNSSRNIFGNLTLSSGMTLNAGTAVATFAATSGTQQITTNGKTLDFPITQNSPGATLQLQDNLTMGSTRTFTLTAGTLDLNNRTLSTGLFNCQNINVRTVAFGTGNITLTQNNATILLWGNSNLTATGSKNIFATYAGGTGTRTFSMNGTGAVETNVPNILITAGTDTVASFSRVLTLDFTGFKGTYNSAATKAIFGGLIFDPGMTITGSTNNHAFAGTSGPYTIKTAGLTLDFPIQFTSVGGTWVFDDALTQGSTRTFTLGATGPVTVQLKAGVTSTVGSFVANSSSVKFLQSTTPGSQATLSQASGTVNVVDLTIRDINAVGGASWNAYTDFENTDAGNNDGWNFSLSPPYSTAELPVTLRPFTQPRRF